VLFQSFSQLEGILARAQSALGNLQFEIQLAELKIGTRQIGYQSGHDLFLRPFIGKQGGTRRFGRSAIAAPEIDVPRGRSRQLSVDNFKRRDRAIFGVAHAGNVATSAQGRKLVGVSDPKLGLGLKNSRSCNAHVVVILQSRPD
jgi:hypothetical protein